VAAEFSLSALVYNLRRVLNIMSMDSVQTSKRPEKQDPRLPSQLESNKAVK